MVYRKGNVWYTRVGRRKQSCETPLKSVALAMDAWANGIKGRHDLQGVRAAITTGRISLVDAYKLGEAGTVAWLAAQDAKAADIDLRPQLEKFLAWRGERTKGLSVIAKYRAQLTVLFPEPAWPRSWFTAGECTRRLDALTGIKDPTRNRYRAALSAFCKYLVRVQLLPHNPIRDTDAYEDSAPHVHWHEEADAQRLIAELPERYRVREVLMAACGLDWTDTELLTAGDISLDKRTVRCHGSKTYRRNRVVRITEAWTIPYLRAALKGLLPTARVCPSTNQDTALAVHKRAEKALGLKISTLHDWRHHYVVTGLKRGERIEVLAHQLGNTVQMMLKRYAPYIPQESDYLPDVAPVLAPPLPKEA